MKILVVGGDSRLSKTLLPILKINNYSVVKTSRKFSNKETLFLDFENIDEFKFPEDLDFAIVVGGVTDYNTCEDNYEYAYKINCVNIPQLIKKLLKSNVNVIFISTNTVFMKNYSHPKENEERNPGFPYATLKSITEEKIIKFSKDLSKENKLSILRLTKNVSLDTSPFDQWLNKINNNESFNAFNNLFFAPITFEKSSEAIINIIKNTATGIFHISGERDISYSEFGKGLLKYLKKDQNLCIPINSKDINVQLRYNHFYTSLSMKHTSSILDINYVSLDDIYYIFKK